MDSAEESTLSFLDTSVQMKTLSREHQKLIAQTLWLKLTLWYACNDYLPSLNSEIVSSLLRIPVLQESLKLVV